VGEELTCEDLERLVSKLTISVVDFFASKERITRVTNNTHITLY